MLDSVDEALPWVMSLAASSVRLTNRLPPTSLNDMPASRSSFVSSRALSMNPSVAIQNGPKRDFK